MLLCCLVLGILGRGPVDLLPSSLGHQAEQLLASDWKDSGAPGMAAAVVKNGKVVFAEGFGLADVQSHVPAMPETVFRIGSLTKQFTALMIMQLVQEGKLDLDQTAKSVIPDQIPDAWSEVTVRQLLNHTAGIPNWTKNSDYLAVVQRHVRPGQILDSVREKPLDFPAGTKWSYSNSNYVLLGLILEKMDGRPIAESLRSRILAPLGMSHTSFASETAKLPHRATGYTHDSKKLTKSLYINMVWPFAAGAMESTVVDLAKWDAALYGRELLRPSFRDQLWTPAVLEDGRRHAYGMGWVIDDVNRFKVYEHAGGINGFASAIRRAPRLGLTTIVLLNSDDAQAMPIADDLMQLVEPRLAITVKSIPDPDPALTSLLRRAFDGVVSGKPDRSLFADEMNKVLSPEFLTQIAGESQAWGPLRAFDLVEAKDSADQRIRVYQVTYAKSRVKASFVVGGSGLIKGAVFQPE